MKKQNTYLNDVYYNRVMSEEFEKIIIEKYQWLITYVKNDKELDFQTGYDQKQNKSWFSIYRGTSRILQIIYSGNSKKIKIEAANAYKELDTTIFKDQHVDEKTLAEYLKAIRENPRFERYYIDSKGDKKEGYYQTLISRRYTFENTIDDDFIIFDKETVLGFIDEDTKKEWHKDLLTIQENHIKEFRKASNDKLPKVIKAEFGEIDFMGLTWDGVLIIIELKEDIGNGLSPIQTAFYKLELFKLLLLEHREEQLFDVIKAMILQKRKMGLIKKMPRAKALPGLITGVRSYIVIGNDEKVTEPIKKRFALANKVFGGNAVFTCAPDGTLIPSEKFK